MSWHMALRERCGYCRGHFNPSEPRVLVVGSRVMLHNRCLPLWREASTATSLTDTSSGCWDHWLGPTTVRPYVTD